MEDRFAFAAEIQLVAGSQRDRRSDSPSVDVGAILGLEVSQVELAVLGGRNLRVAARDQRLVEDDINLFRVAANDESVLGNGDSQSRKLSYLADQITYDRTHRGEQNT